MSQMNRELLYQLMNAEKKIEINDQLLQERPEIHEMIFGSPYIRSGSLLKNGEIDWKLTPRETASQGKKPKRQDMREDFINGYSTTIREDETYNKDPIPACTYRSMGFDPKLKITSKLICGFISRLQFDIESSDPKKAALAKYALKDIYSNLVRDMTDIGMKNGYLFGEKIWEKKKVKIYDEVTKEVAYNGTAILPKKVKTLDPDNNFDFYIDTKTDELVRIEQHQSGGVVAAPRKKIFWFALDQEYSNIFGTSRYRSAYQAWYFANGLEQALLSKLDTTGEPILLVRFPPGQNMMNGKPVPNDVIANSIVEKVQSDKFIAMPSEKDQGGENLWDISYVELKNSDNDAYLKAIEYFDKKKVESLGMFGNIIAGDANFSEIDAKEDLTLVLIEDMVDQIEACIQKELVDWIVSYNFGPKHIPDVRLKIDRNSLGRSKMLLDILKETMRGLFGEKTARPKELPDVGRIASHLNIPTTLYADQVDRGLLDDQMKKEKELQPKPAPIPGGKDPVKEQQSKEDSNGRNRKTPDERDRERPSAQERMK